MIYSVFVFSKDGSLITSRIASLLISSPEMLLELTGTKIENIRRGFSLKFENFRVDVIPVDDLVYAVVHDEEASIRGFIEELKVVRPKDYRSLIKIIRAYVAPKRPEVEKLLVEFSRVMKDVEPINVKPYEVKITYPPKPGTANFYDDYLSGYYLDARKYNPKDLKGVGKILRLFSARLTHMTATHEEPPKELMMSVLDEITGGYKRYYEGLINDFPSVSSYADFSYKVVRNRKELTESFGIKKMLYTTLAVPMPGITPLFMEAVKNVPDSRRNAFYPRLYASYIAEGKPYRHLLIHSLDMINSYEPFSYAYYLPIAVATSVSLTRGGSFIFHSELLRHLETLEEPRYLLYECSTLGRSIPVLIETQASRLEKIYKEKAEFILSLYRAGKCPHIYYTMVAAVFALAGIRYGNVSVSTMLLEPDALRSIRLLYRVSRMGSRGAYLALTRILPAMSLSILYKDKNNELARDMLIKSFVMIPEHDFTKYAIVRTAEEFLDENTVEILRKTIEPTL